MSSVPHHTLEPLTSWLPWPFNESAALTDHATPRDVDISHASMPRAEQLDSRTLALGIAVHRPQSDRTVDLRKQLADFERSIQPMRDASPIGELICMA